MSQYTVRPDGVLVPKATRDHRHRPTADGRGRQPRWPRPSTSPTAWRRLRVAVRRGRWRRCSHRRPRPPSRPASSQPVWPSAPTAGPSYVTNDQGTTRVAVRRGDGRRASFPRAFPWFASPNNPNGIVVSAGRGSVYVANLGGQRGVAVRRSARAGCLRPRPRRRSPAASLPWGIAISPDGASVYASRTTPRPPWRSSPSEPAGCLRRWSPRRSPAGAQPLAVAVSPDSAFVYVNEHRRQHDLAVQRRTAGAFTPMGPPTVPAGAAPRGTRGHRGADRCGALGFQRGRL